MHQITLKDGTVIKDLELNGNNFISKTEITEGMFTDNLEIVTISDGTNTSVQENMKLVQIANMNDEYWFVLTTKSKQEIENERLKQENQILKDTMDMILTEIIPSLGL
jgi:hypothetical protein